MDYKQAADKAIELAGKHTAPNARTNAGVCLQDAIECLASDKPFSAYTMALNSLRYSAGLFHRDYVRARELEDN